MRPVAFAFAALIVTAASAAGAHTLLLSPEPLTNDDNAKSGPCGCYYGSPENPNEDLSPLACPGTYPITELVAGQQLEIAWIETINHDGAFRLAFSTLPVTEVAKADVAQNILYDEVDANNTGGATLTATVTVPSTPCNDCTLQLRQDMGNTFYYSCAAIRIVEGGGSGGGSATSTSGAGGGDPVTTAATGTGGAGSGATSGANGAGGSTGPGMATEPPPVETGSACGIARGGPKSATSTGLFALALAAFAARIVKRRTPRAAARA